MTFGGNLLLARLLSPDDFGLLSMVAIFSALAANISGCGMSDGLINKKDPTKEDYSTVFTFNVTMGLLFACLFITGSGLIAEYFGYYQLRGIMIAIGICFFFQSLCMVQETRMRKELDFKKMAVVRLSATASSLVLAIILVLNGYSYWGLVSMQVFLSFFLCVYYMLASRWIPRLGFYRESFKEMFGYGVHLMLAYVCYQTARNINTAVLGKYSIASASGAYGQAQKVEEVPFSLTEAILNWPFFAVLSSAQSHAERRRLTGEMHSVIIFVNTVIASCLFVVSSFAFNALYGSKWDAAIPIFRILLLFGLATSVKMFYQTVFKAHSKTRLIRNLTIAEVAFQLLMLLFFYKSSTEVIALTQTIPAVALLLVYIPLYIKLEQISVATYFKESFLSVFIPAGVVIGTVLVSFSWIDGLNSWIAMLSVGTIFSVLLITACEWLRPGIYLTLRRRFKHKQEIS